MRDVDITHSKAAHQEDNAHGHTGQASGRSKSGIKVT